MFATTIRKLPERPEVPVHRLTDSSPCCYQLLPITSTIYHLRFGKLELYPLAHCSTDMTPVTALYS